MVRVCSWGGDRRSSWHTLGSHTFGTQHAPWGWVAKDNQRPSLSLRACLHCPTPQMAAEKKIRLSEGAKETFGNTLGMMLFCDSNSVGASIHPCRNDTKSHLGWIRAACSCFGPFCFQIKLLEAEAAGRWLGWPHTWPKSLDWHCLSSISFHAPSYTLGSREPSPWPPRFIYFPLSFKAHTDFLFTFSLVF